MPLFVSSKILSLNMLYVKTVLSKMCDISFKTAPSTITDFFIEAKAKHDHDTRFSSFGTINSSRLNQRQGSFGTFGAKLWNSTHVKIRNLSKGLLQQVHPKLAILNIGEGG